MVGNSELTDKPLLEAKSVIGEVRDAFVDKSDVKEFPDLATFALFDDFDPRAVETSTNVDLAVFIKDKK